MQHRGQDQEPLGQHRQAEQHLHQPPAEVDRDPAEEKGRETVSFLLLRITVVGPLFGPL